MHTAPKTYVKHTTNYMKLNTYLHIQTYLGRTQTRLHDNYAHKQKSHTFSPTYPCRITIHSPPKYTYSNHRTHTQDKGESVDTDLSARRPSRSSLSDALSSSSLFSTKTSSSLRCLNSPKCDRILPSLRLPRSLPHQIQYSSTTLSITITTLASRNRLKDNGAAMSRSVCWHAR